MIFDTHAHYDSLHFNEDRMEVLQAIRAAGVDRVVNISNSWEDMLRALEMVKMLRARRESGEADALPAFYATVGIHPSEIRDMDETRFEALHDYCKDEAVVAVGEIGLDYYWQKDNKEQQRFWFRRQLALAKEENLPVVIHSRDASQETFDMMKEVHAGTTGGIIHCYSGSVEMAREYVKLGYYLGIGGVVTYKNSKVLKQVVTDIPLSNLVLETDCPYLTPTPHRGKRNCSAYLTFVADTIAELKGVSKEEVEQVTYQNALDLYHIGE